MSCGHRAMDKVQGETTAPAVMGIMLDDGTIAVFGGKQLKAGGQHLFPKNVETKVFVIQSGPDHSPHVGFVMSMEHGELHGPCSTGAHFEAQGDIIRPVSSYNLFLGASLNKVTVRPFLDRLSTLPDKHLAPSVVDANKKGTFLL